MILLRTLINEFTSIRIHVLFFLGSHVRGSPLITKKKHDVTTISTFVSVEIPPSFVGILMLKVIKNKLKDSNRSAAWCDVKGMKMEDQRGRGKKQVQSVDHLSRESGRAHILM
jgi:hypothetical protein